MNVGLWIVLGVVLVGLYFWYAAIVVRRNRVSEALGGRLLENALPADAGLLRSHKPASKTSAGRIYCQPRCLSTLSFIELPSWV